MHERRLTEARHERGDMPRRRSADFAGAADRRQSSQTPHEHPKSE
jgi:hypothetical protein